MDESSTEQPSIRSQELFERSGLKARAGFNLGSGALSFTVDLPQCNVPEPQRSVVEQEDVDAETVKPLLQSCILWCMLSLLPSQRDLEQRFVGECATERKELLANRCLSFFAKQTRVTIREKTEDTKRHTIRIVWMGVRRGQQGFTYSPSYTSLCGVIVNRSSSAPNLSAEADVTMEPGLEVKETMSMWAGSKEVNAAMVRAFWDNMERKQRYFAAEELYR